MKNVTYLIGAGFSAPFNIPIVKEFYKSSQKINYENKEHFKRIFEYWEKSSIVKHYAKINMFNIEELLSLLEMENFLKGNKLIHDMKLYISDVVNYYLPKLNLQPFPIDKKYLPQNWMNKIFVGDLMATYGYFFLSLLNITISKKSDFNQWKFVYNRNEQSDTNYFLISMNYDLLFERLSEQLCKSLPPYNNKSKLLKSNFNDDGFIELIKLHGSADNPESIIPPTWNKLASVERVKYWQRSYEILKNSNQIRVLGYSMPISDTYFRYFLMNCIKDSTSLEKFQVFVLDKDNSVKTNYDSFFENNNNIYEFYNTDILYYLGYNDLAYNFEKFTSDYFYPLDFESIHNNWIEEYLENEI